MLNKGKELEKLPVTEKVDCLLVSTSPVKSAIENQLQQVFDMLLDSLKTRTLANIQEVSSYLMAASDNIEAMPQTVQEIGEANARLMVF